MSFRKIIFVLLLIFFLVPTNGEERFVLYTTAQRTMADIGGFCGRNPDVCEKVAGAFDGILRKLKTTASSIEDMLQDAGIAAPRGSRVGAYPAFDDGQDGYRRDLRRDTTSSLTRDMSDTLTSGDKSPAWKGPQRLSSRIR
jgi:hypothetical protein